MFCFGLEFAVVEGGVLVYGEWSFFACDEDESLFWGNACLIVAWREVASVGFYPYLK